MRTVDSWPPAQINFRGHLGRKLAARSTASNICVTLYPSLFVSAQFFPLYQFLRPPTEPFLPRILNTRKFETGVYTSNFWGIDAYLIANWHPYYGPYIRILHVMFCTYIIQVFHLTRKYYHQNLQNHAALPATKKPWKIHNVEQKCHANPWKHHWKSWRVGGFNPFEKY